MVKWIKKLQHQFFHNIKIKQKLLFSYFVLLIVPFFIVYFFTYNTITRILEKNIHYSASQNFEQTFSFLSYKLYKTIKSSDIIFVDDKVHAISEKDPENYDVLDQIDDMNKIQSFLSSFEDTEDILRVRLYVPDHLIYSDENLNFFNIKKAEDTIWHQALLNEESKLLFCPSQYLIEDLTDPSDVLSIARLITNLNDYSSIEGLLRVDFDKKNIFKIISKANPIKNSFTFIENTRGVSVVSSNEKLQSEYGLSYTNLQSLLGQSDGFKNIRFNNETFYVNSQLIPNTDWYMTTVIPNKEISSEINSKRRGLLIIIIVISLAGYFAAYLISYFITKRINSLVDNMKDFQSGGFNLIEENHDQDEIGILIENYNYMLHKITSLMDEQYNSGQLLKSAELKALQAQINPHFLYNTLEMINWMAKKQQTNEILAVTKSLSKFYKLSLSQGKDLITLRDEIQHVEAYIQIQNMRFSNKIQSNIQVDEEALDFIVPKIILQPLVENAIIHGILEKQSQTGTLQIHITKRETFILIKLIDDGVGIPAQILENIFSVQSQQIASFGGSHYGLKNIHERLELMYMGEASIQFYSTVGVGTTVEIRLPLNR